MTDVKTPLLGRLSFFSDVKILIDSLEPQGYRFVRDSALESLIIGRIRQQCALSNVKDSNVLNRIPLSREEEILALLRDPMTVLVTAGTSMGLAMTKALQREYPDQRLIVIAGCSAFNGGYGGVALYQWKKVMTFDRGICESRSKIVRIEGGEVAD